ncbi:hypothetical protein SPHINGO8AM_120018 [Sphingomonas sp. 8AM]|nr:hypothetical protein SPHINGO8AM_120018 [Sphingomonas sp. 8AM]
MAARGTPDCFAAPAMTDQAGIITL